MDTHLERSPVYQQLTARLRLALVQEYQCGDQFLTEREISEKFQVSRVTANKALASLVSSGLLEFRKGLGTFVRRNVIDYDVRSLVSFTEKARAAGKKPTTQLLSFEKCLADQLDAALQLTLAVEPTAALWTMKRLRLAEGVPVILEHRYIVHEHCPKLTKSQSGGSLYQAWTETHGLQIGGANELSRAARLADEEAQLLQVPSPSPALEVVAIGFLENSSPLWWERTLYRGDLYEFHSRLGPIQSGTPPRGVLR